MNRSKWKGPYISPKFLKKNFNQLDKKKSNNIISRNSKIIQKFIGLTFEVHTGKIYKSINVTKEMIGYKFGEFVPTRGKFSFKKKKTKKK